MFLCDSLLPSFASQGVPLYMLRPISFLGPSRYWYVYGASRTHSGHFYRPKCILDALTVQYAFWTGSNNVTGRQTCYPKASTVPNAFWTAQYAFWTAQHAFWTVRNRKHAAASRMHSGRVQYAFWTRPKPTMLARPISLLRVTIWNASQTATY